MSLYTFNEIFYNQDLKSNQVELRSKKCITKKNAKSRIFICLSYNSIQF